MTKETKKTKEPKTVDEMVEPAAENNKTKAAKETVKETIKETEKEEKEGKVGLLLKEMRNKQGKTFAEISQELCIRKNYLEAIENSDYNNIPEYPYGIGFIRSYADYLGLDGNKIVKMYKEEAEADFRKNHPYFVMEPQVEATVPSRKYLLISLFALVVIYGAWEGYNNFMLDKEATPPQPQITEVSTDESTVDFPLKVEDYSTNEEQEETDSVATDAMSEAKPETENETTAEADTANEQITVTDKSFTEPAENNIKEEKKEPETQPSSEASSNMSNKPAKSGLTVNVLKETWIEVKNEKTLYISKVLQPGDSYTLPKAENLKLSVGKADGVEVMYNGKKAYEFSPNRKINISVDDIIAGAQD